MPTTLLNPIPHFEMAASDAIQEIFSRINKAYNEAKELESSSPSGSPNLSIQTSPPSSGLEDGFWPTTSQPQTNQKPGHFSAAFRSPEDLTCFILGNQPHNDVRCLILAGSPGVWAGQDVANKISAHFPKIKSLEFRVLRPTPFNNWSFPWGFLRNLTSLVIRESIMDTQTFHSLFCAFRNLENLKLSGVEIVAPEYPGPSAMRAGSCDHGVPGCLIQDPFANLPMAFSEICVENCHFPSPKFPSDLFATCQETVKKVKLYNIQFPGWFP